jgi:hypothetical protein
LTFNNHRQKYLIREGMPPAFGVTSEPKLTRLRQIALVVRDLDRAEYLLVSRRLSWRASSSHDKRAWKIHKLGPLDSTIILQSPCPVHEKGPTETEPSTAVIISLTLNHRQKYSASPSSTETQQSANGASETFSCRSVATSLKSLRPFSQDPARPQADYWTSVVMADT